MTVDDALREYAAGRTSNDGDAVIEHVAAYMWESRMERVEDRTPWEDAGATWKTAFREMAVAAGQALTMP